MFRRNHIITMNNVNNLYNQSFEVEYVLHVMASAAYNVNLQPHTYVTGTPVTFFAPVALLGPSRPWLR